MENELIEQEVPVTEQVETNQESDNTQAAVETTPTPQESFRQLREKAERAERERDEMRVALQKIYAQGPQTKQPEDDEDPSELIERRHLKRYESELTRVKEELSHTRQSIAEQHLKAQYPDFEKVVNRDTIEEFRSRNPKLAASLAATDDLFEKGAAVYTLIKNMGIYREDNYAPDRIKAENNAVKPKPTNSISPQRGESPLSHANAFANGLTDDLRKQLWREMDQARKAT